MNTVDRVLIATLLSSAACAPNLVAELKGKVRVAAPPAANR